MPRSVKKGPFIHYKLLQRIKQLNDSNQKKIVKTWSRASIITPDFVVIQSQFIMETNDSIFNFTSRFD